MRGNGSLKRERPLTSDQISPVEDLVRRVPQVFNSLAPERRDDFAKLKGVVAGARIIAGAQFEAETAFGMIRISLESLERLWAFCFGYLKVRNTLRKKGWKPGERVELKDDPDYDQARHLLNWAT